MARLLTRDNLGTVLDNVTLGSAVVLPAGHVIQTYWDEWAPADSPSLDVTSAAAPMGTNLQVTMTPESTSNVLNIKCFIPCLYNHADHQRSMMAGFRYSTASDFSSSVKLGTKQFPVSHHMYHENPSDHTVLGSLSYEVWIAPPVEVQIWVRPWMQSTNGEPVRIFTNADDGSGVSDRETGYLSVQEIKQ
tara:strand:+ start:460 stop:1029 length:570 start_codon:yes stop_codon:yes gene_type:complete